MSLELPPLSNEIWTEILKGVKTVGDWGRLQQVSHVFNAIVRTKCWPQVKELKLTTTDGPVEVELNGEEECLVLSDAKLLLFVDELANKATKIQAVSLQIIREDENAEEDGFGVALQRLSSASFKVKELEMVISGDIFPVLPLARFLTSVSGTLENLSISIFTYDQFVAPELHQAIRNFRELKAIKMWSGRKDPGVIESVLDGKTQLETVQIAICPAVGTLNSASAFLNSGAHLLACNFRENGHSVLETYTQLVQERNLVADHPLKTLKVLTFGDRPGFAPTIRLFPDLEKLNLSGWHFDIGHLNAVIAHFLAQYRDAPGVRRALYIRTWVLDIPPLDEIQEQMVLCPVSLVVERQRSLELSFVRGNATAKAIMQKA